MLVGRTNIEFAAQLLNAFNHPNFLAVGGIGTRRSPPTRSRSARQTDIDIKIASSSGLTVRRSRTTLSS